MSPSRCLPLERMRVRASSGFLALRLVEAFLHQLGVAEDGGERRPQLVAHVGDELRLVLAGDLQLAALLRDLLEQARVLQGDGGLVGEGLHEADDGLGEFARPPPLQHQRSERALAAEQRDDEGRAQARFERSIAQWIARALEDVGDLQRLPLGDCLAEPGLSCGDVELSEPVR